MLHEMSATSPLNVASGCTPSPWACDDSFRDDSGGRGRKRAASARVALERGKSTSVKSRYVHTRNRPCAAIVRKAETVLGATLTGGRYEPSAATTIGHVRIGSRDSSQSQKTDNVARRKTALSVPPVRMIRLRNYLPRKDLDEQLKSVVALPSLLSKGTGNVTLTGDVTGAPGPQSGGVGLRTSGALETIVDLSLIHI